MIPEPNLAPPAVRNVTPLVVKPAGGRYIPQPFRGATEPKSIMERLDEAAANASRLLMCSTRDWPEAVVAKESVNEKTNAHNATVIRGV